MDKTASETISPRPAAGVENLKRLKSRLRRCPEALSHLRNLGLNDLTVERFHLGIRDPFERKSDHLTVTNALACPLVGRDGRPRGKYLMYNMPGVTVNPVSQNGWCAGGPTTYWSGKPDGGEVLIVVDDCRDLWLIDQSLLAVGINSGVVLVCSSHGGAAPEEWLGPEFWEPWELVVFAQCTELGEMTSRLLSRVCGRDARRLRVPGGFGLNWRDFFTGGGDIDFFLGLLKEPLPNAAPPLTEDFWGSNQGPAGEYAAEPVNINGAYVGGHLYYPFTVEHRTTEPFKARDGSLGEREVTCYKTKVVRSDGAVLEIELLPAPRGTPRDRRVLALTDGTRIEREPEYSCHSSWQLESIRAYADAVRRGEAAPHRRLSQLLSDTENHLRQSARLPYQDDYALLSAYVALSYVYQVFPAVPLVMVTGEKGTGKTELGEAMAAASFNAVVVGQGSAASVVRLLNETRGLAVIDDVESLSKATDRGFGDLSQMLKLSYKKQTGRKAITVAGGKTVAYDFYGPKVVTNTRGVDPVLGSRMLHIRTRKIPGTLDSESRVTRPPAIDLVTLRNEFHAWGMANAGAVAGAYELAAAEKSDRFDEITAPLRAVASLAGDAGFQDTLEKALRRQSQPHFDRRSAVEILIEAVSNCILRGARRRLTAAQLVLELRLLTGLGWEQDGGERPLWRRSAWMGQQLKLLEIRDGNSPVTRARLHGRLTRIYQLNQDYVSEVLKRTTVKKPADEERNFDQLFNFCLQNKTCDACSYHEICPSTLPGLSQAKESRRRPANIRPA